MNIDKIIYTLSIYSSIIFFLLCTIIFFKTSSAFDCNNLIVEGSIITNEKNILDKASNYRGISVFDIDINSLEKDILDINFVSDIKIDFLLPNTMIINVNEINPIGKVKLDSKNYLLDDNENSFIYNSKLEILNNYPEIILNKLIHQNEIFVVQSYHLIKKIFKENKFLYNQITAVEDKGDYMIVHLDDSHIYFDNKEYVSQLAYLFSFFQTISNKEMNKKYEYIKFYDSSIVVKENNSI